jgi:hypothetical protein
MDDEKKVEDNEDKLGSEGYSVKNEGDNVDEVEDEKDDDVGDGDKVEAGDEESLLGDEKVSESLKEEEKDEGEGEDSSEKDNKGIHELQNSQIKWIVLLMLGVIVIIVGVPFVTKNFVNTFEYEGLEYQKTKLGDLIFYSARFPVVGGTGNVIGTYAVNFRNDPRDLERIPVDTREEKIYFNVDKEWFSPVYISLDPFMEMCEGDVVISMASLSGFLKDSGFEVIPAYTDKAYARDNNGVQRWCNSDGFDTVFVVTDGDETSITEIGNHCYELQFNNCEVIEVTEKLILTVLKEYASRFENLGQ